MILQFMSLRATYMHHLAKHYGNIVDCESEDLRDPSFWKRTYLIRFLEHLESIQIRYDMKHIQELIDYYDMLYDELQFNSGIVTREWKKSSST